MTQLSKFALGIFIAMASVLNAQDAVLPRSTFISDERIQAVTQGQDRSIVNVSISEVGENQYFLDLKANVKAGIEVRNC